MIYHSVPHAGADFAIDEFVPGLGLVEAQASASCLAPGRMLGVAAGWGSSAPVGRDLDVVVALQDEDGRVHHSQQFPLSPAWPTGQWPADALAWAFYTLRLPASIAEGEYGR